MNLFFHDYIETSLESLPVLQTTHTECHDGRDIRLIQTILRNVYTEFDTKLSRYLSATRGEGFPAFTVKVEIAEGPPGDKVNHLTSVFHESMLNALKDIAERAFERAGQVELAIQRSISTNGKQPPISLKRKITTRDIEMLTTALSICQALGDLDFLEISGDFNAIVASPPGKLNPVILHLQNGSVLVPSTPIGADPPFQWPVYAFAQNTSTNPAAQSYLAGVGQSIMAEKEASILGFRSAAERRIVDFQRAFAGRPLEGHWLKGAQGLVARLQLGLGGALAGISEDAQGIALELSAAIENPAGADAGMVDAADEEPEMKLTNPSEEPEMLLMDPVEEPEMQLVASAPETEAPLATDDPEAEVPLLDPDPVPEMPLADPASGTEATQVAAFSETEVPLADPDPEAEMPLAAVIPETEAPLIAVVPEKEVPLADPVPETEIPLVAAVPGTEMPLVDPDPETETPLAADAPYRQMPLLLCELAI